MPRLIVFLAVVLLPLTQAAAQQAASPAKPRVVITADPELDDLNSLIRLILYASDFKLEGLIYTSSQFHWKGDGKGTTQFIPGREYTRPALNYGPLTNWRWAPEERFIDEIIDAYAKVYPNLKVHNPAYPTPDELRSKVKWGNIEFDGDYSKDTEGSDHIKALLLDNEPGPLFVTAQGGQSTIARALKSIYDQYSKTPQWEAIRAKVSQKLVISPSGDQDGAAPRYIRPNWPDVRSGWAGGGPGYGYGARGGSPENAVYVSPEWTQENISSRGPLGALYRVWGDGKEMVKGDKTDYFGLSGFTAAQLVEMGYMVWTAPGPKGGFIGEGDNPTYLNFLDLGLRSHENATWGGWGGRGRGGTIGSAPVGRGGFAGNLPTEPGAAPVVGPSTPVGPDHPGVGFGIQPAGAVARELVDKSNPIAAAAAPAGGGRGQAAGAAGGVAQAAGAGRAGGAGAAGGRGGGNPRIAAMNAAFFAASQHDFAARLKWSVTPQFKDANHEPVVRIVGARDLEARVGATVNLRGSVSDPDNNKVSTRWWQYNESGTYTNDIAVADQNALETTFRVPEDATAGQTIHFILEAKDDGIPSLTRYQRVVITVRP